MKQSELLQKALREYGPQDFMCHVLSRVARGSDCHAVAKQLTCRIEQLLMTEETITLMNYLVYTDPVYAELKATYGHYSEQCHNYRVDFWRKMITELESEGL